MASTVPSNYSSLSTEQRQQLGYSFAIKGMEPALSSSSPSSAIDRATEELITKVASTRTTPQEYRTVTAPSSEFDPAKLSGQKFVSSADTTTVIITNPEVEDTAFFKPGANTEEASKTMYYARPMGSAPEPGPSTSPSLVEANKIFNPEPEQSLVPPPSAYGTSSAKYGTITEKGEALPIPRQVAAEGKLLKPSDFVGYSDLPKAQAFASRAEHGTSISAPNDALRTLERMNTSRPVSEVTVAAGRPSVWSEPATYFDRQSDIYYQKASQARAKGETLSAVGLGLASFGSSAVGGFADVFRHPMRTAVGMVETPISFALDPFGTGHKIKEQFLLNPAGFAGKQAGQAAAFKTIDFVTPRIGKSAQALKENIASQRLAAEFTKAHKGELILKEDFLPEIQQRLPSVNIQVKPITGFESFGTEYVSKAGDYALSQDVVFKLGKAEYMKPESIPKGDYLRITGDQALWQLTGERGKIVGQSKLPSIGKELTYPSGSANIIGKRIDMIGWADEFKQLISGEKQEFITGEAFVETRKTTLGKEGITLSKKVVGKEPAKYYFGVEPIRDEPSYDYASVSLAKGNIGLVNPKYPYNPITDIVVSKATRPSTKVEFGNKLAGEAKPMLMGKQIKVYEGSFGKGMEVYVFDKAVVESPIVSMYESFKEAPASMYPPKITIQPFAWMKQEVKAPVVSKASTERFVSSGRGGGMEQVLVLKKPKVKVEVAQVITSKAVTQASSLAPQGGKQQGLGDTSMPQFEKLKQKISTVQNPYISSKGGLAQPQGARAEQEAKLYVGPKLDLGMTQSTARQEATGKTIAGVFPIVGTLPALKTSPILRQVPVAKTSPKTTQVPKLDVKHDVPLPKPQPGVQKWGDVVKVPKITGLTGFRLPKSREGEKVRLPRLGKPVKGRSGYFPSVEAILFNIKGKKPSSRELMMGLSTRPLLR